MVMPVQMYQVGMSVGGVYGPTNATKEKLDRVEIEVASRSEPEVL